MSRRGNAAFNLIGAFGIAAGLHYALGFGPDFESVPCGALLGMTVGDLLMGGK